MSISRPDWEEVYRGLAHAPDRDGELIEITRETARLAKSALRERNAADYYHNSGAAERELCAALEGEA